MCGIFGIVIHNGETVPDKDRLEQTARLLEHRGPDSYGIYSEQGIGLVHTRLSLLDLAPRSDQPFWDQTRRYCLIYNGEIYNFRELRAELEDTGIKFRTASDTEVLLESLIKNGIDATLPRLEGMFAFALYDRVTRGLTLARDRFGTKPIFIYDDGERLIFASEVRAMKPWTQLKPDLPMVSSFLHGFWGPTKRQSFFENIKFLPPGSIARLRIGQRIRYDTYFFNADFIDESQAHATERMRPSEVIDKVEELLLESVKKQLVADVPVGALCSGGVDSSLILAMAARFHNNLAIFHSNVVGRMSEYSAAQLLAKHLHLDLEAVNVYDKEFIDELPVVTEHFGQPIYPCPHAVPLLMVTRLIHSKGVKAVISGEGSDECYLGYNFIAPDLRRWKEYSARAIKNVIKRVLLGKASASDFESPNLPGLVSSNIGAELNNRFEVALEDEEVRKRLGDRFGTTGGQSAFRSLVLLNYNLRALLHRNDTMGMAASVEARFPFLDTALVKFAVNMPYKYKIRLSPIVSDKNHHFYSDKWVVRKVAERYLPAELMSRPKLSFPIDAFQRMEFAPSFIEKSFVPELFGLSDKEAGFLMDRSDQNFKLKLLHLHVWASLYLYNKPKHAIATQLRENIRISGAA